MSTLANRTAAGNGANGRCRAVFFPCIARGAPLERWPEAAKRETAGNAALLPSVRSSFARFRPVMHEGAGLWAAAKTTGWGAAGGNPNRHDNLHLVSNAQRPSTASFAPGFFEGKLRRKQLHNHLNERTHPATTP